MPGWRARSDTPEWVSTPVHCAVVSLCTLQRQAIAEPTSLHTVDEANGLPIDGVLCSISSETVAGATFAAPQNSCPMISTTT